MVTATVALLTLPLCAAVPTAERDALISLYNSTDGDNYWWNRTNWLGPAGTECTWYGVTCDEGETTVVALNLSSNGLRGEIPPEIGALSGLRDLNLNMTGLTGPIPPELGNLTNLVNLQLTGIGIRLTGTIPAELGNLTNLVTLLLEGNQLTGVIPAEIANLSKLEKLTLGGNQLSGGIPTELYQLQNLRFLSLSGNPLRGNIAPGIGNMSSLEYLGLSACQLDGEIPPDVGNLAALAWLYLEGNSLVGAVPPSLLNLTRLQYLTISYNALHSDDESVINWLTSLDHNWQETQTVAPKNITVTSLSCWTDISWDLIAYSQSTGRYEVWADSGNGPYLAGMTEDKETPGLRLTGLSPGTPYTFKVRTITGREPGFTKVSEFSDEFRVVTPATVVIAIANTAIIEGNVEGAVANFEVTLSQPSDCVVEMQYRTVDWTATAGEDYVAVPLTNLIFEPGQRSKSVPVAILADTIPEGTETFAVELISPTNAVVLNPRGVATIIDDDVAPALSIGDVTVTEGTGGNTTAAFPVFLSREIDLPVTVEVFSVDGTARAGDDYQGLDTRLEFLPFETSLSVVVTVIGDSVQETDEIFELRLANPTNADVVDSVGTCTILDDDDPLAALDPAIKVDGCQRIGDSCALSVISLSNRSREGWAYNWRVNGNLVSVDQSFSPSFEAPGTFDVEAFVSDSRGRTGYAAVNLNVGKPCPDGLLCLVDSRFTLSLTAHDHRTDRTARGVPLQQNDLFGYYSFPALTGNSENPEVFVKMLDGRTSNGQFWIFYGGLTDLEYTLTVVDSATGLSTQYRKAAGSSQGGFDVGGGVTPELCQGEIDGTSLSSVTPETCDEGDDRLCLADRFEVDLIARDHRTGNVGIGLSRPRNGTFGYFALPALTGNANNPEVFVKIIDGGIVNGFHWIFFSGLTDMEYTVTVTDTVTGQRKIYTKPPGSACGAFDTNAF